MQATAMRRRSGEPCGRTAPISRCRGGRCRTAAGRDCTRQVGILERAVRDVSLRLCARAAYDTLQPTIEVTAESGRCRSSPMLMPTWANAHSSLRRLSCDRGGTLCRSRRAILESSIQELPFGPHCRRSADQHCGVHRLHASAENQQRDRRHSAADFEFTDYQRSFGGFLRSTVYAGNAGSFGDMATAVNQFFLNGGTEAYVVGLLPSDATITAPTLGTATGGIYGTVVFTAREVTDATYSSVDRRYLERRDHRHRGRGDHLRPQSAGQCRRRAAAGHGGGDLSPRQPHKNCVGRHARSENP